MYLKRYSTNIPHRSNICIPYSLVSCNWLVGYNTKSLPAYIIMSCRYNSIWLTINICNTKKTLMNFPWEIIWYFVTILWQVQSKQWTHSAIITSLQKFVSFSDSYISTELSMQSTSMDCHYRMPLYLTSCYIFTLIFQYTFKFQLFACNLNPPLIKTHIQLSTCFSHQ